MSVQSEIDRIKKNVNETLKTISDTGVTVGAGSDSLPAAGRCPGRIRSRINSPHPARWLALTAGVTPCHRMHHNLA